MTESYSAYPPLARALAAKGYDSLTPVQREVLNPELEGQDLLVSAQTGSGKTVAFGLAIAPTLLDGAESFEGASAPLALVIAPTRELAMQVKRELIWLYGETGAQIATCVGGMDYRDERRALARGAHIVVGTPGRLCDHLRRNSLDLSETKAIILDEADEMLDMGFQEDLELILDAAPEERRTLMFSATVSKTIAGIAQKYQKDAVRVTTANEQSQHADIDYKVMAVHPNDRENAIVNVLRFYEARNALVFCATRATVSHMTARLNNRGFSVVALSGELSQKERSHALMAMRDGRARVCVATDVAARGIDLPGLELVIHADLPRNGETLLHRSGRTGRAGRKGTSVLIATTRERGKISRLLGHAKLQAEFTTPPGADEVIAADEARLLSDDALLTPTEEHERELAEKLLKQAGGLQLATAFIRAWHNGRSAPEELMDVNALRVDVKAPKERQKRQDFENGDWIKIESGRRDNVQPKWLIPALCKSGGFSKAEIGNIKIYGGVTFVELQGGYGDQLLTAIGPDGVMDKGLKVVRAEGPPAPDQRENPGRAAAKRPQRPTKARSEKTKKGKGEYKGKKSSKFVENPHVMDETGGDAEHAAPRNFKDRSKPNFAKKNAGKKKSGGKSKKPKFSSKMRHSDGSAPPKRKSGGKSGGKSSGKPADKGASFKRKKRGS